MNPSTRSPAAASHGARIELRAVLRAVSGLAAAGGNATWVDLGSPVDREDAHVVAASAVTWIPRAELIDPAGWEKAGATIADASAGRVLVTCLHVLHELPDPAPALGVLLAAAGREATVVLSVPDVAPGAWGANPAEELRRLLPADAVAFRVVALRGAALVPAGAGTTSVGLPATLSVAPDAPAVAHVLAFGADAQGLVGGSAEIETADLIAERAERRALSAELDVLRAELGRD